MSTVRICGIFLKVGYLTPKNRPGAETLPQYEKCSYKGLDERKDRAALRFDFSHPTIAFSHYFNEITPPRTWHIILIKPHRRVCPIGSTFCPPGTAWASGN
jgi:hypothetical protein